MAIKKYMDWKGWFEGLIDSAIPAGATAVITLLTTNGAAHTFSALSDIGMTWKQALAQIGIHMTVAAATYLKNKPRPVEVTEQFDTETIKKDQ